MNTGNLLFGRSKMMRKAMNEMDKVNYNTRREKRLLRRIFDKDSNVLKNMLRVNMDSMLSDEELAKQNDKFPGNEFSWSRWSAESFTSASEIRSVLTNYHLVGKRIWDVWTFGHDSDHEKAELEKAVRSDLTKRLAWEGEKVQSSSSIHALAKRAKIPRQMEIVMPLILEFYSNETFEISVDTVPTYRVSMNKIPRRIFKARFDNVDPRIMFSPILGRTITSFDLQTTPEGGQDYTVTAFLFRLDNGMCLKINGGFDELDVELLDGAGNPITASIQSLRHGFFNYEDLHFDPTTGFKARDSMLWFGWKGKRKVGPHPITVTSIVTNTRGRIPAKTYIDNHDALGIMLGLYAKHPEMLESRSAVEISAEEWRATLEAGLKALDGPRLTNDDSPFARLLFETPPPPDPPVWYTATDEDRMRTKRERCHLCLSETLRWSHKAIPAEGRVRIEL